MPVAEQNQIAASVKEQMHAASTDGARDEALERVRAGWQNRGYFKVQVNGEARLLASSLTGQRIALFVHVDEGPQYRLGGISFKGNKAVSNLVALRSLFPIKEGDIFSRDQIAKGLENLRKAYGQLGYINFTSVPNTAFDDEKKLIHLDIDIDEGKQFYISRVNILGLGESRRQELLDGLSLGPGKIFNARLFDLLLQKNGFTLTGYEHLYGSPLRLDEGLGTVAINLDFRPCSAHP